MIVGVDWSQQLFRLGRRSVDMAMEASVVGASPTSVTTFDPACTTGTPSARHDRANHHHGATSGLGRAAADELEFRRRNSSSSAATKRRTQMRREPSRRNTVVPCRL